MNVDGVSVVPIQSVGDLGIYVDADLVMRTDNPTYRNEYRDASRCYSYAKSVTPYRQKPTDIRDRSIVLSRLGYGNAVLLLDFIVFSLS